MTKKNNYKRKRITRKKGNFKKKRTLKKHYKQNIKIRGGESNPQYIQQHIHNSDEQHSNSDCHDVNQLNELIQEYITANENSLIYPQVIYPQVLEDISPSMLDLINKMKDKVDNISRCTQVNTTYLEANKVNLLDIFKNAANAGLTEIIQQVVNDNNFSSFEQDLKQYATDMTTITLDEENDSISAVNQAISYAAQESIKPQEEAMEQAREGMEQAREGMEQAQKAMEQAQKHLKRAEEAISALKDKDLNVAKKNIQIYYEALTQKYGHIKEILNLI